MEAEWSGNESVSQTRTPLGVRDGVGGVGWGSRRENFVHATRVRVQCDRLANRVKQAADTSAASCRATHASIQATSTRLNAGHRRARTARADGRSDGRGEGTNDRTNDRTNAALGIIADSHRHGQAATIVEQQRRTNAATKRSDQTNARTHAQTNEQQQHNDNKGRKERTAEQRKPSRTTQQQRRRQQTK